MYNFFKKLMHALLKYNEIANGNDREYKKGWMMSWNYYNPIIEIKLILKVNTLTLSLFVKHGRFAT